MGIFSELLSNKFRSGEHIAPLVITAELHIATVVLIEAVEVISLHEHIGKFQEGKSVCETIHIATGSQHLIYGEMRSRLS